MKNKNFTTVVWVRRIVAIGVLLFHAAANSSLFTLHSSLSFFHSSFLSAQTEKGYASFYGKQFSGLKTASGERLSNDSLTCAHRTLPFGTFLKVTNMSNDKEVVVRVNDRGPFVRGRIIDVTRKAAHELDFLQFGTAKVSIEVVHPILPPLVPPSQSPLIQKIWELAEIENMTQFPTIEPAWLSEP
jgi:rare lipoprotein A